VADGGYAAVYSGKDGSLLLSFNADYALSPQWIGSRVTGAGDTNNDGFTDFMLNNQYKSSAFLYSGRDGGLLYHFQDPVSLFPGGFGYNFALTGDLDSDGHADFLMTDPAESNGSIQYTGSISAWRGHAFFVDATPRVAVANDYVTVSIGQCIAGNPYALFLRDLNGTPAFSLLSFGVLDSNGRATLVGRVPSGIGANSLEFQAFTLDANNKLLASGVETFFTQ